MDESVAKYLEKSAVDTMPLSAWIRLGHPLIKEARTVYLYDNCGCAIGAALAARGYTNQDQLLRGGNYMPDAVSKLFNIPRTIAIEVSVKHCVGEMNRLQIADWLEGQGY